MLKRLVLVLLVIAGISGFLCSLTPVALADETLLVSPFKGSRLEKQLVQNYNSLQFPEAPMGDDGDIPSREILGRISGYAYVPPEGTRVMALYQSYKSALQSAGAALKLDCDQNSCGRGLVKKLIDGTARYAIYSSLVDIYNLSNNRYHYLSADFPEMPGTPSVVILLVDPRYDGDNAAIIEEMIEPVSLASDLVTVNRVYQPEPQPDLKNRTAPKADAQDTHDHPLISRFPSTYIDSQTRMDYAEFQLATGPLTNEGRPLVTAVGGRLTVTNYSAPADLSLMQLYRNYEDALQKGGFTLVFSCDSDTCGKRYIRQLFDKTPYQSAIGVDIYNIDSQPFQLLSAQLLREQKPPVYVSLIVNKYNAEWEAKITLAILEMKAMDQGLVKVDLNFVTEAIKNQGRVALYGIYFDFDKASLRPESGEQLQLIADYLNAHPQVELYVVGHTDNSGSFEHNTGLSEARATAVVSALKSQYKIAAGRLQPVGIGPVAPVSANSSENAMQKNRRVELVLKAPLSL